MPDNLEAAEALLQAQTHGKTKLNEIAKILDGRPGIIGLLRDCDVARYDGETVFFACVDAERPQRDVISFWFEIAHKTGAVNWEISASISRVTSQGSHLIEEMARTVSTPSELVVEALAISEWLLAKVKAFDFLAKI